MQKSTLIGIALVQLACLSAFAVASIENEPVKVTLQNAGPSYDWAANNEVERTRLVPPQPSSAEAEPEGHGHLTIRRIFLIPVHGPPTPSGSDSTESQDNVERPSSPFSLFQSPSYFPWRRQPSFRQPAEGDSAIERPLPPAFMNPGEREESQDRAQVTGVDPLQLMLNILKQTLHAAAAEAQAANAGPSKQPSERFDKESPLMPNPMSELDKPNKSDETTEEVVEVEGKKYLRKMVVTKHVGDNLFFVTRRLIFTPLNETSPGEETTTTTTTTSTEGAQSTLVPSTESFLDAKSEQPSPPSMVPSSTTTSTTTTTTSTTTTETPSTSPAEISSTVSPTTAATTAAAAETEPSSTAGEELTTTVKPAPEVVSPTTTSV